MKSFHSTSLYTRPHSRASSFFPAGNTIAMPTEDLAAICLHSKMKFPALQRITVYGSSQYIVQKGLPDMRLLREAGLSRIHVGLESGDDTILKRVKKGTNTAEQIQAGKNRQTGRNSTQRICHPRSGRHGTVSRACLENGRSDQ